MDRREALRLAGVLTAGTVASACDAGSPTSSPAQDSAAPATVTTTGTTAPAAEIVHGPRDRAMVALTFHGQGDPAIVARLLDELAKGQAHVTVLAVGTWLA